MSQETGIPFESIESAQQFIRLLVETVVEAKRDVDNEITLATDQMSYRRVQALRMVEYNLEKLQRYLSVSGRTLNDLRSLRRLLLKKEKPATRDIKHHQLTTTAPLALTVSPSEPARVAEIRAVASAQAFVDGSHTQV